MADQPQSFSEVFAEELRNIRDFPELRLDPEATEGQRRADLFRLARSAREPLSALCLSGGGIRSATFCLGALQGLAEHGLLEKFDYLSTVSGGGYIGSWLTSWIHREGSLKSVTERLRTNCASALPETVDPVEHLRNFNSYLTPRLGLFSTDTWTLLATIARNCLLNWLVLAPLLLFVLMLPRVMVSILALWAGFHNAPPFYWFLASDAALVTGIAFAGVAIYNIARFLPAVGNVPHRQSDFVRVVLIPLATASVLVNCSFLWLPTAPPSFRRCLAIGFTISFGGWALFLAERALRDVKGTLRFFLGPITLALGLGGFFTAGGIWLLYNVLLDSLPAYGDWTCVAPPFLTGSFLAASVLFVGLTSNVLKEEDREWLSRAGAHIGLLVVFWIVGCTLVLEGPEIVFGWQGWKQTALASAGAISAAVSAMAGFSGQTLSRKEQRKTTPVRLRIALALAPPVFLILLVVMMSVATNWILAVTGASQDAWWDHDALLNHTPPWISLGASGLFLALGMAMAYFVNINRFSLHAMYRNRLVRAYLGASNARRNASPFTGFAENDNIRMREIDAKQKPFHLLNLTLNLVAGSNLAWQQRKAQSFTVSPLYCGNSDLGYRSSVLYGHGISLGTAMTISGAAASPSMGYHSSPVVAFIMTLFNARLGAWLGNPGEGGRDTWKDGGPKYAVSSLVKEALGRTDNTSSYVYLSDGGHFENLGIYEMVQRRCGLIVAVDCGCDGEFQFEDLGNAIRKIRIDLKIPIEFEGRLMNPVLKGEKRCAIGRICYSCVDGACQDGYLIYIKPMMLGGEPADVQSYHASKPAFPHESTANQWFNESQTESYRMLGLHTMNEICLGLEQGSMRGWREHIENQYLAGAEV